MSKQINFFAGREDIDEFLAWLMARFPEMSCILRKADAKGADRIFGLSEMASSLGHAETFLIPIWALDELVFCPPGSKITVNSARSPVLEFIPPVPDDSTLTLKVGRVYWNYSGNIAPQQERDINAIFNWVRTRSRPKGQRSSFRLFPSASKYQSLRGWAGEKIAVPAMSYSDSEFAREEEKDDLGDGSVSPKK